MSDCDDNCLFCKIIKGKVPSYKIYEDEYTYAFLDIAPSQEGHCLVIPKSHTKNLLTASEQTVAQVMVAAQKVSNHFVANCGYKGVRIGINNEPCAGQVVLHWHVHVVPYYEDKPRAFHAKPIIPDEELGVLHTRLKMQ